MYRRCLQSRQAFAFGCEILPDSILVEQLFINEDYPAEIATLVETDDQSKSYQVKLPQTQSPALQIKLQRII